MVDVLRDSLASGGAVNEIVLQGLKRRREHFSGPVRVLLDARIATAESSRRDRHKLATPVDTATPYVTAPSRRSTTALAHLAEYLNASARRSQHCDGQPLAQDEVSAAQDALDQSGIAIDALLLPMQGLRAWQDGGSVWAALRLERELTRAQPTAGTTPGPLNSQWLVSRTLLRLQMLCPAYLAAWVAQLETLQWLLAATSASHSMPAPTGDKRGKAVRKLAAAPNSAWREQ